MLQNPADFATAVDALFDTQKQAMAAGESAPWKFYFCLLECSEVYTQTQYVFAHS